MKKCLSLLLIILSVGVVMSSEVYGEPPQQESSTRILPPDYLYKVLSVEDWKESQSQKEVVRGEEDTRFIHLATEEQLDKIIKKFWSDVPEYVVLKLETKKLSGNLIYETNEGGTMKYFHLYEGAIPASAVIDADVINLE